MIHVKEVGIARRSFCTDIVVKKSFCLFKNKILIEMSFCQSEIAKVFERQALQYFE